MGGARDGQEVWGGVCGNAAVVLNHFDEETAEPQGEALNLPVSQRSNIHL